MSTTTKRKRSAFVSEALMLRALHDYRAARDKAEEDGLALTDGDMPGWASMPHLDDMPSFAAMSRRYDRLLDEWASEDPDDHAAIAAYLDLVAAIIDGERAYQREIDAGVILSAEKDLGYALTLLTSVRRWLNEKAIGEYIAAENARIEAAARGGRQ